MKRSALLFAFLVMVLGLAGAAQAYVFNFNSSDDYIGGTANYPAYVNIDQIGPEFELRGLSGSVNFTTGIMTVVAHGAYFTNYLGNVGNAGSFAPGPLWLTKQAVTPSGSPPYPTDVFNPALWDYVIDSGGVHAFNPSTAVLTSAPTGWAYRQTVFSGGGAVTGSASMVVAADTATWIFSLASIGGLSPGDTITMRELMGCGNDILQQTVTTNPVPLPPTLLLLGSGLVGLGLLRKKKWFPA